MNSEAAVPEDLIMSDSQYWDYKCINCEHRKGAIRHNIPYIYVCNYNPAKADYLYERECEQN